MSGGLSCRSSVYKMNLLRLEYAYMLAFKLHKLYTYIYMSIRGTNPIFVVSIAVVLFVMRDLDYHLPWHTQNHEKWKFYTSQYIYIWVIIPKNEGFTWETPWKPQKNPRKKKTTVVFWSRGPCHFSWILWVGILGLATSRGFKPELSGWKIPSCFSVLGMVDTKNDTVDGSEIPNNHLGWC